MANLLLRKQGLKVPEKKYVSSYFISRRRPFIANNKKKERKSEKQL